MSRAAIQPLNKSSSADGAMWQFRECNVESYRSSKLLRAFEEQHAPPQVKASVIITGQNNNYSLTNSKSACNIN